MINVEPNEWWADYDRPMHAPRRCSDGRTNISGFRKSRHDMYLTSAVIKRRERQRCRNYYLVNLRRHPAHSREWAGCISAAVFNNRQSKSTITNYFTLELGIDRKAQTLRRGMHLEEASPIEALKIGRERGKANTMGASCAFKRRVG